MFKNIQKYLLLNHPLLWNTKIVPMTILLLIINLIFFAFGFNNGKIDFKETNNSYSYNQTEPVLVFVGVLISLIIIILWLVFYLKNNAFKSFYPKNNSSLFKEWLIIFSVIFMIAMFSISYLYAKEVRVRSYFSLEKTSRRCKILSLGSVFLEGSFEFKTHDSINQYGDTIQVANKYVAFRNKHYSNNSLMNKNIENFQLFNALKQREIKEKTQNWLYNKDKLAIKALMKNYLLLANEHRLKTNIDENKWLELVYNEPSFEEINIVGKGKISGDYSNYNSYATASIIDDATASFDYINKFKVNRKGYIEEYFKNYVPAANLNYAYEKIADAWISPDITVEKVLFPLYFALGFSLLIFTYRISSGRNWIIALISLGIINIVFGIFSALFSTEKLYLVLCTITIIVLFSNFIYLCHKKNNKGISGITLNVILWTFGAIIPLLYALFLEFLKWKYNYTYEYGEKGLSLETQKMHEFIGVLNEDSSTILMMIVNFLLMLVFLYFMSIKIKNWKGIPEN